MLFEDLACRGEDKVGNSFNGYIRFSRSLTLLLN